MSRSRIRFSVVLVPLALSLWASSTAGSARRFWTRGPALAIGRGSRTVRLSGWATVGAESSSFTANFKDDSSAALAWIGSDSVSGGGADAARACRVGENGASDADFLDAYSRAVIAVVEAE